MTEARAIGFTGSRHGMSVAQARTLRKLLADGPWKVLHHGDCVGCDVTAHGFARELGLAVVVHPPESNALRARLASAQVAPPLPYLDRNRAIVASVEHVIATPRSVTERSGGTWYTIRYAVRHGKLVSVIDLGGRVLDEEEISV
ncbi:hypothetical protein UFOVP786_38 [uncultured Caudovirales phage]|uniref:Uncharacterized protein n=1 Tax=uncultured Caudovirales phage TaxID=2100421 RepID=A0A6J5NYK4_9CAUD|nr:hypothetical protein UFOVP786_38 [uncultured Caudovirales phage]